MSEEDLTRLFGDLEEVVVSLDRLLSRIGAGDEPDKLVRFVVERNLLSVWRTIGLWWVMRSQALSEKTRWRRSPKRSIGMSIHCDVPERVRIR
ncbi:hypothetical protein ABZ342_20175 [Amycolatopsis sp. NPDC005961]|uniref:hypothetical protein n=1 Tax=Amycolatopsis sp. NPDC005961 TaxID=3156720 RepID=UPI00340BFE75